jgi:flagellar biosynthesis/type III secretory pathway protein FliH
MGPAQEAKLPAVTELSEVQAMLSRNVTRWDVRAMEKGRQEGRKEGLIEGHTDRAQRTLERQLTRRFGALPPEAQGRIHQATLPQLETWLDRIIDAPTWQAVFDEH